MDTRRAALRVFAAIAMVASASAAEQIAKRPQSGEIQHEIRSVGAKAALNALYRDDAQWTAVLRGIASGDADWLSVGEALRRVSDAHLSEQLDAAVGEALGKNAQLVLSRATGPFELSSVCSSPDIDDERFDTFRTALAELNRRISGVERVTDATLARVRTDCLASLRASEPGLRRFFGIK